MPTGLQDLTTFMIGQAQDIGASPVATKLAAVTSLTSHMISLRIPASGGAGTDNRYTLIDLVRGVLGSSANPAITVTKVTVNPEAALTASDSNYKTFTVVSNNGAAGSDTTIAQFTTQITGGTGNWVAATRFDGGLSATIPNRTTAAGACVQLVVTHTGTGVSEPAYTITVEYTEI